MERGVVQRVGKQAMMNYESANPDLEHKVKKEHVRKSLPALVEKKTEVQELQEKVQGSCFDAEYAVNAVQGMQAGATHFQNIQDLLKNAMFMKQQLHYQQQKKISEKITPSMYRRIQRTSTADLPRMSASNPTTPTGEDSEDRPRAASLSAKRLLSPIN